MRHIISNQTYVLLRQPSCWRSVRDFSLSRFSVDRPKAESIDDDDRSILIIRKERERAGWGSNQIDIALLCVWEDRSIGGLVCLSGKRPDPPDTLGTAGTTSG